MIRVSVQYKEIKLGGEFYIMSCKPPKVVCCVGICQRPITWWYQIHCGVTSLLYA